MSCKACTEIPPVQSDYKPAGTYDELQGTDKPLKTWPSNATRGLIGIYDIFGMHPATQQGADRLAQHLKDTVVIVPDFFHGKGASLADFPPDTEEKKQSLMTFFATHADFKANAPILLAVAESAKSRYPNVKAWGCYGLCWGGKVAALTAGKDTPFKVSGTAHPGRLAVEEAERITVPFISLFSPEDGSAEEIQAYAKALEKNPANYTETYDMHHGWMAARARLNEEKNTREFERGYAKLAEFYDKHLS